MKTTFKPAWWLANPHLQTLWPPLCRRAIKNLKLTPERLELADGDFLDIAWAGTGNGPIVIVLHGLEGSIDSAYAKGTLHALVQHGWRAVFVHFRGCSGESNRSSRFYHSGETSDLAAVVAKVQRRAPRTPLAAVGFSLGGNVLLKWLGETGAANPLTVAIAISVPFELDKAAERINQGFSKVYQKHFLKLLSRKVLQKFSVRAAPFELPTPTTIRTLREFDHLITAPLHGFNSGEDYYQKSSSRQFLSHIQIPTLLIQANDDPFMLPSCYPTPDELSPHVQFELTPRGGHVGFIAGRIPGRPKYWLEQRVPEFLCSYL